MYTYMDLWKERAATYPSSPLEYTKVSQTGGLRSNTSYHFHVPIVQRIQKINDQAISYTLLINPQLGHIPGNSQPGREHSNQIDDVWWQVTLKIHGTCSIWTELKSLHPLR